MTQLLDNRLHVGLRWEPLLGLEREAKEIRTLLARRSITRYVVYAGEMGARSLGLLQADSGAEPQHPTYSFLCLVGAALKQKSFLFVHPHPDDAAKVVLVGVRDDRPELDDIYDAAQAPAAIERFLAAGSLSDITIAGVATSAAPHLVIDKPQALEDLLSGAEQRDLKPFAITHLKPPVSLRNKLLSVGLFAVVIVAALAARSLTADDASQLPVINPTHTFESRLNRALLAETADGGSSFVRAVEAAVRNIPVDVNGWRAVTIKCGDTQCVVDRRRQVGADATAMLGALENVKLKGLDQAIETVRLARFNSNVSDVRPISETSFSARTAARMQQLGDYGLTPTLGGASPIIPLPASVSSAASLNIVKRGIWSLGGDLAFLDSMTGLITQSGNMVLKSLQIDVAAARPSFTAKGFYYVK